MIDIRGTAKRVVGSRVFWVALILGGALAVLGSLVLRQWWPPVASCTLASCDVGREWLLIATGAVAFVSGLLQYRRGQEWERAKFLAGEMRVFLGNPRVGNALRMIDWSRRNINLYESKELDRRKWPLVSRSDQTQALFPHPARGKKDIGDDSAEAADSELAGFSHKEVAIRDCFDEFLNGLEQFESYVATGLIDVDALRPYIGYWIQDIAAETTDLEDCRWTAALLAYIEFYGYPGVQRLFKAFGNDIRPTAIRWAKLIDILRWFVPGGTPTSAVQLADSVSKKDGVNGGRVDLPELVEPNLFEYFLSAMPADERLRIQGALARRN